MSDILDQAKSIQRRSAMEQRCWVTLAFIEDMIAEIERLQALVTEGEHDDGREIPAKR